MSKYKVVKDVNYTAIYDVYKQYFGIFWKKIGCVAARDMETALLKARDVASPNTGYF